jgi:hypothetical protein
MLIDSQKSFETKCYVEPLARVMGQRIESYFRSSRTALPSLANVLDFDRWSYTSLGLVIPFDCGVVEFVRSPKVFSRIVKPMAVALADFFSKLTEAFTQMNCAEFYETLRKTERGPLSAEDLERIRATPRMKPMGDIRAAFHREGLPEGLLDVLLPLVQARCGDLPEQQSFPMWRKGFGYALVLSGSAWGSSGTLRIMPVAHLGPAGVVETFDHELERVRLNAPVTELRRKDLMYLDLASRLTTEFPGGTVVRGSRRTETA